MTRSPGLNVLAVMPMAASSLRLSISSRHCCAVPFPSLTSMNRKGCGLISWNCVTLPSRVTLRLPS